MMNLLTLLRDRKDTYIVNPISINLCWFAFDFQLLILKIHDMKLKIEKANSKYVIFLKCKSANKWNLV